MLSFPNAKINLGLQVRTKREDGYHEIETVFYPLLSYTDALELFPTEQDQQSILGIGLDIPPSQNLAFRAYAKLQEIYPEIEPQHLILQKNIPSGAGLGGGSADAAFVLRMLIEYYDLDISPVRLTEIASDLGADVPFFIQNTPCLATGIGERLKPINLDLSEYEIELITSDIHISTPWAFSQVVPDDTRPSLIDIIELPVSQWRENLHNDFEQVVYEKYPQLAENKKSLYDRGALYASLTGTGSAVYGIFERTRS